MQPRHRNDALDQTLSTIQVFCSAELLAEPQSISSPLLPLWMSTRSFPDPAFTESDLLKSSPIVRSRVARC